MKYLRTITVILLLLLLQAAPSDAQDEGTSKKAEMVKIKAEIRSGNYAIIIGINNYDADFSGLQFSEADALGMYDALVNDCGYDPEHIYLFLDRKPDVNDPSYRPHVRRGDKPSIMDIVHQLSEERVYENEGTLLFFFSGHGARIQVESDDGKIEKNNFIMPVDGRLRSSMLTSSNINLEDLIRTIKGSKFPRKLIFIDACRNDLVAGASGGPGETFGDISSLVEGAGGIGVFMAAEPGKYAWEYEDLGHSVFSNYLIESLKGAAADEYGLITIGDLMLKVSKDVTAYGMRQDNHVQTPYSKGEYSLLMPVAVVDPPIRKHKEEQPEFNKNEKIVTPLIYTWGGTASDFANCVDIDVGGDIYIGGYFYGTADLDPGSGIQNHSSQGSHDAYYIKLDSSGSLHWAKTWGGLGSDSANRIAIDARGNVYITGVFNGYADLYPGPESHYLTSLGGFDPYLIKLDSSVTLQGLQTWGGTGEDSASGLAIDAGGNIYISGGFQGTADLDPGSGGLYRTSKGGYDAFLMKLDSSATLQWVKTWGGAAEGFASSVAIDAGGNVYIAGHFYGTADLDPGFGILNRSSKGDIDAYLLKLDSSGTLQWAKTWGGTDKDMAKGLAINAGGDVYISGGFKGATDLDPGPGILNRTSQGEYDAYLLKLNSSGTFQWAKTWGGSDLVLAEDVATDAAGDVYIAGGFFGTSDLDPGSGTQYRTSQGRADAYLIKLDSDGNLIR